MTIRVILLTSLILSTINTIYAQNFSGGFEFYLPPDDSTTQRFLPVFPAEEIQSFLATDGKGHFTVDGEPIRFWGVNLTTGACFPVKEKASFIAARMRKMGINLVRFHHMDNGWTGNEGTIFIRGSGNTRQLDPVALDRLHFLLAQMKREGVFANMNLHVSRTFLEGDGVIDADSIQDFGKGVTYFDPVLIELQKEYARQLLTAENPYTGLAMVEDPVLGMVEITNENTLYGMWKGDQLKPFTEGGTIMRRHAQQLDAAWQQWLTDRYTSNAALQAAWEAGSMSNNPNLLQDPGFESGSINQAWNLELHESARASMQAITNDKWSGSRAGLVDVTAVTGTDWHIQFQQKNLSVQKDSSYTLSFYARADRNNRPINVGFQRDENPWTFYGGTRLVLSRDWELYRVSFKAPETNTGKFRINVNFANETGQVWLDDFVFSLSQQQGLESSEALDQGNVKRIDYAQRLFYSPRRVADLAAFYLKVQRDYYQEMYAFLKDELGVRVPITGTNALVGPSDVYTHQDLDYIDDHAYWNHPRFPNEPWSPTDWLIDNQSMIPEQNMGTISGLFGGLAMQDKPYTISEYNHPFPNRYHWEMVPILAAHASFHDADGLMFFQYHDNDNADWETDHIDNFFSLHRNNTIMSLFPVFSHIYRQYMIEPAQETHVVEYSEDYLFNLPQDDNLGRWGKYFPYNPLGSVSATIRTGGFSANSTSIPEMQVPATASWPTPKRHINWMYPAGVHLVNAPGVQVMTGAIQSVPGLQTDDMELSSSSEEGVVSWVSLEQNPLAESSKSLLSIHSRIQNTGMRWQGTETVNNQWGGPPTVILPLEVSLSLRIDADSIRIYPLDSRGQEDEFITLLPDTGGKFNVTIDQDQWPTPWFGIEAFRQATATVDNDLQQLPVRMWPNPVQQHLQLELGLDEAVQVDVRIYNLLGQQVYFQDLGRVMAGQQIRSIDLSLLPTGSYVVQMESNDRHWRGMLIKH